MITWVHNYMSYNATLYNAVQKGNELWTKVPTTAVTSANFCAYFSLPPSLPAPGEPNLKAPEKAIAWLGDTLKVPCHSPCKFFSYEKYWCKWSNKGCKALPSQSEASKQASVNCDPNNQLTSLILNPVTKEDAGWYWCGVKDGPRFGDTVAVYVEVKEKAKGESSRPRPASPGTPKKGSCWGGGGGQVWL